MPDFCGNCGAEASHRHHVVPKSLGGSDKETNLVWLCGECHGKVHGKKTLDHKNLQKVGIEKAKARGVYKGRKPIAIDEDLLRSLISDYVHPIEISERLGCSRSTIYRVMRRLGIKRNTYGYT